MTASVLSPNLPPAAPAVSLDSASSTPVVDVGLAARQLAGIVAYFETLSPESVARLGEFYAAQAHFTDPFNNVIGVPAIQAIFAHMFVTLKQPRFVVTQQVCQGTQCFLTWEFRFYFSNYQATQEQVILGASHLVLSDSGLIKVHRDYWDAAQELYEKLPLVGSLMRWLRARVAS
jgi:hypothetical protein